MSERKDNKGALFKNQKKVRDEQPTHTGACIVDGKEYWISAWVKEKDGNRFFSLAFSEKQEKSALPKKQDAFGLSEKDGEIPF